MSVQAIVWALEEAPACPPEHVSLLIGLANHADREGRHAWPSVATLARYTRKSERVVQRGLRALVDAGLIRPGDQRLVQHLPGGQRPNVWDLAMSRTRGDAHVTGDANVTPVVCVTGDAHDVGGVTPTSPKPSTEPSNLGTESGNVTTPRASVSPLRDITEPASPPPAPPAGLGAPSPRCPQHDGTAFDGPCGDCADARRDHEAWRSRVDEQVRRAREQMRAAQAEARRVADAERDGCVLCDAEGRVIGSGLVCQHDAAANARIAAARGEWQAVREELSRRAAGRSAQPVDDQVDDGPDQTAGDRP